MYKSNSQCYLLYAVFKNLFLKFVTLSAKPAYFAQLPIFLFYFLSAIYSVKEWVFQISDITLKLTVYLSMVAVLPRNLFTSTAL